MTPRVFKRVTRMQATVVEALALLRQETVGTEAVLLARGKYCGRPGIVDGVSISPIGEILALLMILRKDGKAVLNNDGPSRTYWPLHLVRFTGRRIYYPEPETLPPQSQKRMG